jgi:excisionase family DNA binding protein
MNDEILSIRLAELLKINEKTAYRLALAGKNPGFKVGGSWRFGRQEIANWIKRKVEEQQGQPGVTIHHRVKSLTHTLSISHIGFIAVNAKMGCAKGSVQPQLTKRQSASDQGATTES